MMKKVKETKGFTLAELLIVVAIIAVLVAVSIPIFTSKLEKAREATDIANLRAAKAAAVTAYLSDDDALGVGSSQTDSKTLYYNSGTGKLVSTAAEADAIGKGTAADGKTADYICGNETYTSTTVATNKKIQVTITTDGDVTCKFV